MGLDDWTPGHWIGAAFGYVFLSTFMGLLQPSMWLGPWAWAIAWGTSMAADVVFIAGTVGVGWGIQELMRRRQLGGAVATGLLGTWAVYIISFSLVTAAWDEGDGVGFVVLFVLQWGWMGIIAATVAPVLVLRRMVSDGAAGAKQHAAAAREPDEPA